MMIAPERVQEIEQMIAAIDPEPWRMVLDDDEWVLWFHARLDRDPRKIVISYEQQPSENEVATANLLVNCREIIRELLDFIQDAHVNKATL